MERFYFMQQEISIYHPPGNFVFFVRDEKGTPIYIGGTENINEKVFKYKFPFSDITGYYYKFPDFWDEVDRQICEYNPIYNTRLHGFATKSSACQYAKEQFAKKGFQFKQSEKKKYLEFLQEQSEERYIYNGCVYFTSTDKETALLILADYYGIDLWNIS